MKRRIFVYAMLILLLCAGAGGFAAEKSVMTSFSKPGHVNVYACAGLYPGAGSSQCHGRCGIHRQ